MNRNEDRMDWFIELHNGRMYHCPDKPLELARELSRGQTGNVTVTAHARVRAIFERGELVREWPSLDTFYTNIDEETNRRWRNGL